MATPLVKFLSFPVSGANDDDVEKRLQEWINLGWNISAMTSGTLNAIFCDFVAL